MNYLSGGEYGYDQININYDEVKDNSVFLNTHDKNGVNDIKNREERLFSKMDKYFTKPPQNQREEDIAQMMCNKHTYPRKNEQCSASYIPNLFLGNNRNILPDPNNNSRKLGIVDGMLGGDTYQGSKKENNNMLYLLIFLLIIVIIIQYHKYSNGVKFIMVPQPVNVLQSDTIKSTNSTV
jgi:hypothetical protein